MTLNKNDDKIHWDIFLVWLNIFIYCILFWVFITYVIVKLIAWGG